MTFSKFSNFKYRHERAVTVAGDVAAAIVCAIVAIWLGFDAMSL